MNIRRTIVATSVAPVVVTGSAEYEIDLLTNEDPYGPVGVFSVQIKLSAGSANLTFKQSLDEVDFVDGEDVIGSASGTGSFMFAFAPLLSARLKVVVTGNCTMESLVIGHQ